MTLDIAGMKRTALPYGVGTLAYIDGELGLIRCRVTAISGEDYGFVVCGPQVLTVEVLETKGGYFKGEVLQRSAYRTPPRKHRVVRGYSYRILTNYVYRA